MSFKASLASGAQWAIVQKWAESGLDGEFSGTLASQMRAECKRRKITTGALLFELIRSYRRNVQKAHFARN